jgi:hypothetical protein
MQGLVQPHFPSDEVRRQRTLATAEPLLRMRSIGLGGPLEWVDHRDVALYALGRLLDTWGLGGDDDLLDKEKLAHCVADRIAEQGEAAGKTPDQREARAFGHKVVDALLNSKEHGGEFTGRIYDHGNRKFEDYSFRLVVEDESDDNRFYLQPTPHASNLYFESFTVDVQDELIGQRLALDYHIYSGRTDKLAAAAERHRRTAARLLTEVRGLMRRADRSIRAISADIDVIPLLRDLNEMADQAGSFERNICKKLDEQRDIATGQAAFHIENTINAIVRARQSFLSAREKSADMLIRLENAGAAAACRAPRISVAVPDLETEVFRPLMDLVADGNENTIDRLLQAFLGAAMPDIILDPVALADCFFPAPLAEADDGDDRGNDADYSPEAALFLDRFGDHAALASQAQRFVLENAASTGKLSRLITLPAVREMGPAYAEAITLVVCAAFKDQGADGEGLVRLRGLRLVVNGDEIRNHPAVSGTDIHFEVE